MKLTLTEIVQQIREIIQDESYSGNSQSQLTTDEQLIQYVNEGYVLACKNSALLKTNDTTIGEVLPKAIFQVFNTQGGSVENIVWGEHEILNTSVAFNVSPIVTARNISNKINILQKTKELNNRFSSKAFIDEDDNVYLEITAPAGSGSEMNDIYPEFSLFPSNLIMIDLKEVTNGEYGFCKLVFKEGQDVLYYSDRIVRFIEYRDDKNKKLCVGNVYTSNCADIVYGESTNFIRLTKKPKKDGYIIVTVEYLPEPLIEPDQIPEIHYSFHSYLVNYAVYKVLLITDIEAEQISLANRHYDIFKKQFGEGRHTAIDDKSEAFKYGEYR